LTTSYAAVTGLVEKVDLDPSKQKTLKKSVSISGVGLFTAERATLTIHPAESDTGLLFQRSDLPGAPTFPADLDHVVSTPRCTILGRGGCTIHTVEHVLAALSALGVTNALLQLSGPEVPIMDGSSQPFVEAILDGEIAGQEEARDVHFLQSCVSWTDGNVHLIAIPAEEFSVSFTMHFPQSQLLGSQYLQVPVNAKCFSKEIAPCRTFCLYEEIAPFIESGLIKGGGLDNAVIIKNDAVINPEGIRFKNEMVRHKVLDLIGDLALIPSCFVAHIVAICSGHASNIAFAKQLYNQIKREKA